MTEQVRVALKSHAVKYIPFGKESSVTLSYEVCACGKCGDMKINISAVNLLHDQVYFKKTFELPSKRLKYMILFTDGEIALVLESSDEGNFYFINAYEDAMQLQEQSVNELLAQFAKEKEERLEGIRSSIKAIHGDQGLEKFDKIFGQMNAKGQDMMVLDQRLMDMLLDVVDDDDSLISFMADPFKIDMMAFGPNGVINSAQDLPKAVIDHFRKIVDDYDVMNGKPKVLVQIASNDRVFYADFIDPHSIPEAAADLIAEAVNLIGEFVNEKTEAQSQAEATEQHSTERDDGDGEQLPHGAIPATGA